MSNRFLVKVGVRDEAENLPAVLDRLLELRERRRVERRRLPHVQQLEKRNSHDRRVLVMSHVMRHDFDVLVIDDASRDHTSEIVAARSLACLRHQQRRGISFSTREAMHYALRHGYDACVMLDGDGQHDPQKLPHVLAALAAGADLAQCTRYYNVSERLCTPLDRDLMRAAVVGMLADYVGWEPLTDPFCGFWGMRRGAIEHILPQLKGPAYDDVEDGGYGVAVEMLLRLWLLEPRPERVEIPHPAIYANGTARLGERYRQERLDERLQRIVIHTKRILRVLADTGLAETRGLTTAEVTNGKLNGKLADGVDRKFA